MKTSTAELVNFVISTEFDDLPKPVIHEAKRVLLDSIGCAIAGIATDKGKLAIKLARRLGGPPEATIIGMGDRVSCTAASFANGELINALDYDTILIPMAHVAPMVIPAPLALAESVGASGRDLIVAVALAHELSCRLGDALTKIGDVAGTTVRSAGTGYGPCIIPGAAGAGKILKLDAEQLSNALGIAGFWTPVSTQRKYLQIVPAPMIKYCSAGWMSEGEVTAALLAEMGYTGDPAVLDGEIGYWKFVNAKRWEPDLLTRELGKIWRFMGNMSFKPYPCCRDSHTPIEGFSGIIEENRLMPEDIEKVRVFFGQAGGAVFSNMEIRTQVDAQFSVPYLISVVAHKVRVVDWQDLGTMKNPKILEFMKKVSIEPYPEALKAALGEQLKRFSNRIEVHANGKTFVRDTTYAKGDPVDDGTRINDDELVEKFIENASRFLPWNKIKRAAKLVMELESVENVSEVLRVVSL